MTWAVLMLIVYIFFAALITIQNPDYYFHHLIALCIGGVGNWLWHERKKKRSKEQK